MPVNNRDLNNLHIRNWLLRSHSRIRLGVIVVNPRSFVLSLHPPLAKKEKPDEINSMDDLKKMQEVYGK